MNSVVLNSMFSFYCKEMGYVKCENIFNKQDAVLRSNENMLLLLLSLLYYVIYDI